MITIPEVVEEIVLSSPFLEEILFERIVNYSALTRKIKPEVEKQLLKEVKTGAILMALRRFSNKIKPKMAIKKILGSNPNLTVRSNLVEFVIANSNFLINKHRALLELDKGGHKYFMTITEGVFETTIIAGYELYDKIKALFSKKQTISVLKNLSSITVHLPVENVYTPGLYYFFLKVLAWKGINVIEVVSTYTEITIVLESKEIDMAFSLLKKALERDRGS